VAKATNVLIAGGGIVGTALAWALAKLGVDDIVVVDLDLAGVYASSELNAGGARATWWQSVNIETCRATLEFFAKHAEEFGLRRKGYLWLYDDPGLWQRALTKRGLQNDYGLEVEVLAQDELARRFPLLDRALDELVGATFSPRDGLVNPNAVRSWYRRQAESRGVRFLNRHYVGGVRTAMDAGAGGALRRVEALHVTEVASGDPTDEEGLVREILTTHRVPLEARRGEAWLPCQTVVNCLGAWSPVFSAKIGVRDHTEPVRRQIALVGVQRHNLPAGVALEEQGMIVDASGVYFHPEGAHVLAGFSIVKEPPGFDFEYDGETFFETQVWPRLAHRSSGFERCGHVRGWAGLYAVTPDRSGIAGRIAGFVNLFEAHSFTGRGVMQSYGVARNMASLITTGRCEDIDLAPLSRERFDHPERWVTEELHI
jgi:sarcosine oxidase subunit beta